jgi:Na+-driven multidrug efflux pump
MAFVPGLGVAQATAAMVGQALGAGDIDRARRIGRASMVLCCAIMWVTALAIVLAAHPIVSIFDIDRGSPLELYSVEWLRLLGVAMIPAGINIALTGVLHGSGATRTSLRINIWTTIAVQVPLGFLLGFGLGLGETGVWLSFPLAWIFKAVTIYVFYKGERWAVTGVKIN